MIQLQIAMTFLIRTSFQWRVNLESTSTVAVSLSLCSKNDAANRTSVHEIPRLTLAVSPVRLPGYHLANEGINGASNKKIKPH
jgi:hypothetical protein